VPSAVIKCHFRSFRSFMSFLVISSHFMTFHVISCTGSGRRIYPSIEWPLTAVKKINKIRTSMNKVT
jgi:hypothetical protein